MIALIAIVAAPILFMAFLALSADYSDRKDGREDFW